MKNMPFHRRLGFAIAGIRTVARRERSFRSQALLAACACAIAAVLGAGALWWALILLSAAFVLALEAMNAALEYLLDHLHPALAAEIGAAKDAAAGAVLIAAIGAACVGGLMVVSRLGA